MHWSVRRRLAVVAAGGLCLAPSASAVASATPGAHPTGTRIGSPITHLVVIFDENVSFDHYFGTYPNAANTDGPTFHAKAGTPHANGLTPPLLTTNPHQVQPSAPR